MLSPPASATEAQKQLAAFEKQAKEDSEKETGTPGLVLEQCHSDLKALRQ